MYSSVDQIDDSYSKLQRIKEVPQIQSQSIIFIKFFVSLFVIGLLVLSTIVFSSLSINVSHAVSTVDDDSMSVARKPNIVFMLADDLAWNSLNAGYDIDFATPSLKSLVQNGISFSNYYTQEVCTPSRAALLTGRYPISLGMQYSMIFYDTLASLNESEILLPQMLKEHGDYITYGIGKWNLGHSSPIYLPTARGFDYYAGYMGSQVQYWSKLCPTCDIAYMVSDFMYMNTSCYMKFDQDFNDTYSTLLYSELARSAISQHDFSSNPMFLYLAFQAVHDPFTDTNYGAGIPSSYLESAIYNDIIDNVVGSSRQQYAMALNIMDSAVQQVVDGLERAGVLDNTYVIFASDNGGCHLSGGRNGPLRGTKSTLFEGGTKVSSFLYSSSAKLLPESSRGTSYEGLMHVTDWLPTILGLTGIEYESRAGYEIDGFDHSRWFREENVETTYPRSDVLYNLYEQVSGKDFDVYFNGPVAVRNDRFKLLHAFENNSTSAYFDYATELEGTDDIVDVAGSSEDQCTISNALIGNFTYYLFDLEADPYETTNLYGLTEYSEVQLELYALIEGYRAKVVYCDRTGNYADFDDSLKTAAPSDSWILNSSASFVQPWICVGTADDGASSYCAGILQRFQGTTNASLRWCNSTNKEFVRDVSFPES